MTVKGAALAVIFCTMLTGLVLSVVEIDAKATAAQAEAIFACRKGGGTAVIHTRTGYFHNCLLGPLPHDEAK
jgi:hypothetical protein